MLPDAIELNGSGQYPGKASGLHRRPGEVPDRGFPGCVDGGTLTNYLLGKTDRFKAAASGAGSGHHLAGYGHDIYRLWYETELGLPWENRELWESLSPFNSIHKVAAPAGVV